MALVLDDAPLFLTVAEVSRLLRRHPRTLRNWRVEQRGPRAVRLEGYWAYPRSDFEAYLDSLTAQARESSREESAQ
jgi:hypothetical protein